MFTWGKLKASEFLQKGSDMRHRGSILWVLCPAFEHETPGVIVQASSHVGGTIGMFPVAQLTKNRLIILAMERLLDTQYFKANHAEAPRIRVSGNCTVLYQDFWRCPSKAGAI